MNAHSHDYKLEMISCEQFMSAHPNRIHSLPKVAGIGFYTVSNCLCMGAAAQILSPVFDDPGATYIFSDSFIYHHPFRRIVATFMSGLDQEMEELDQAVPLYPLWGSQNIWHWTYEVLPAVIALEKSGYQGLYIIDARKPFIEESLSLFDIPQRRIRYSFKRYHVKELIIPCFEKGFNRMSGSRQLYFFLRNTLMDRVGILQGDRHCYIKRTGTRRIVNEDEVVDVLNRFDFETFIPEEHSFKEKFRYMTNVSCTFTPHGANATMVLAQKKGSLFFEAFGWSYINYCNTFHLDHLGLQYIPLVDTFDYQQMHEPLSGGNYQLDITVNIPLLNSLMNTMMTKKGKKCF